MLPNSARIGEPALDIDRVLKDLTGRRRWCTDLTGGDLLALLLDRLDHVRGRQSARLQCLRVQPDAHGILPDTEHADIAHAGDAGKFRDQTDGGVIAQEQAVVTAVRRGQRHDLQDRRGLLLHGDALHLHRLRQRCHRRGDAILHQDLCEIEVGADFERHDQRVRAIGRAGRLHVQHALHAVDLLFDRQRHRVHHGIRARPRIARGDRHGRRHDVRVLRHRQREQRDAADQHHHDRQHIGQHRPIDEEFRDHRLPLPAVTTCLAQPTPRR